MRARTARGRRSLWIFFAVVVVGLSAYARPIQSEVTTEYVVWVMHDPVTSICKPRAPRAAENVFIEEETPERCRQLCAINARCRAFGEIDRQTQSCFARSHDSAANARDIAIARHVRHLVERIQFSGP